MNVNRKLLGAVVVAVGLTLAATPAADATNYVVVRRVHVKHVGERLYVPYARSDRLRVFRTVATGAQEVGTLGDADGHAVVKVVVNVDRDLVCIVGYARKISFPATLVHIHSAPFGQNGPVSIGFTAAVEQRLQTGVFKGCVESPNGLAVASFPAQFYVNLHTAEFPNGAVRGQLG